MTAPPEKGDSAALAPPARRSTVIAEVLEMAPPLFRGVVERSFQGAASPRAAIKAHCLVCVSYDRDEIRNCTVYRCPLWAYRPYQRGAA